MLSPQMAALIDGILGQKRPVMAPADATARPTEREYGLSDIARRALQKLAEWDGKAGRNVAARLPEGVSLQQGAVPDWIGGPKGVVGGLKRAAPFDAEHALAMGKIRAMENAPFAAPDLLPAMQRMEGKVEGYHGSPVSTITEFDRLAPRNYPAKANRMDAVGTWIAETPEEVKPFLNAYDDAGKLITGKTYHVEAPVSNVKKYSSWDELMDDFNRANKRNKWIGKDRLDEIGAGPRGVAPDGGNVFNKYLTDAGYDAISVTNPTGIDVRGRPQTYHAILDPKRIKILEVLAAFGVVSAQNELAAMRNGK